MSASRLAVVLVSGGLDSATVLAIAKAQGFECTSQLRLWSTTSEPIWLRLRRLQSRRRRRTPPMKIDFAGIGGSALTDLSSLSRRVRKSDSNHLRSARNTVFLSWHWGGGSSAGSRPVHRRQCGRLFGVIRLSPAFIDSFERLRTCNQGRR